MFSAVDYLDSVDEAQWMDGRIGRCVWVRWMVLNGDELKYTAFETKPLEYRLKS